MLPAIQRERTLALPVGASGRGTQHAQDGPTMNMRAVPLRARSMRRVHEALRLEPFPSEIVAAVRWVAVGLAARLLRRANQGGG